MARFGFCLTAQMVTGDVSRRRFFQCPNIKVLRFWSPGLIRIFEEIQFLMSRFDWNEIFFSTNGSFQSFFWGHESHAASTCGKLHVFFPTVIEVICLGGLTYVMAEFFALGPQWVGWIFPLNLLDHVDRMQNAETILGFMFQWSFLGGKLSMTIWTAVQYPKICMVSLQKAR